jgi:hypothetical protein
MSADSKIEQEKEGIVQCLRQQNEDLKAQLMNTSLIHELTKVLHSCTNLEDIKKTLLLAIQESSDRQNNTFQDGPRPHYARSRLVGRKKRKESRTLHHTAWFTEVKSPMHCFSTAISLSSSLKRRIQFSIRLKSTGYLTLPLINKGTESAGEQVVHKNGLSCAQRIQPILLEHQGERTAYRCQNRRFPSIGLH